MKATSIGKEVGADPMSLPGALRRLPRQQASSVAPPCGSRVSQLLSSIGTAAKQKQALAVPAARRPL